MKPMKDRAKPITILMADDDADDRRLTQEALEEGRLINEVCFVNNGEELMDYLRRQGKFAPPAETPRPGLILLDLNMPRKDGRTVLQEIKSDPDLRQIPVVVLTTSKSDEDVFKSYDLGVNSYIVKPVTFEALVDILQTLEKYWFEIVELPPVKEERRRDGHRCESRAGGIGSISSAQISPLSRSCSRPRSSPLFDGNIPRAVCAAATSIPIQSRSSAPGSPKPWRAISTNQTR